MRCGVAWAAAMALAVAGCVTNDGVTGAVSQSPRGTLAFESIDGPPPDVFHSFVQALSVEAETQQVAVVSREAAPAYRVRGYLSAQVAKGRTAIAWAFDVYDAEGHRVRRLTGEENAGTPAKSVKTAWSDAANSDVLRRIAKASMEQLGDIGASPQAGPAAPAQPAEQALALATE